MKKRSNRQKLDALHSFLMAEENPSLLSSEERQAMLTAHGIDVQRQVDWVQDRIAAMKAEERLRQAREERERHLERFRESARESPTPSMLEQVREQIRTLLTALGGRHPQLVAGYFRRFEEASDADLETLLADLRFLQEMDESGH